MAASSKLMWCVPCRMTILALALAIHVQPNLAGLAGATEITLEERLVIFQEVYGGHIAERNATHVRMKNGTDIVIDDGKTKSHDEKLADPDIEDMLSQVYPLAGCIAASQGLPENFDPGRFRNQSFFKAVYGATEKDVAAKLIQVDWYGEKLAVTSVLGVADKLAKVRDALKPQLSTLRAYLTPSAGTFNWRPVAGTSQLSVHAFGAAIDISTAKSDYWRWSKHPPGKVSGVRAKIPEAIIAAFEEEGFIWGGNWYHFDTMHFEYRPELIAIGKLAKARGCTSAKGGN